MRAILYAGALLWVPGLALAQSFDSGDIGSFLNLGKEIIESQQPQRQQPQTAPSQTPQSATSVSPDTTAPASTPSPSRPAHNSVEVNEVQERLSNLGYSPGPIDGMMGSKTVSAIRRFEQDSGLAPTGQIDDDLLTALRNAGKNAPTPAQAATQPSFDCARAMIPSERAICASPALAQLDVALTQAYKNYRGSLANEYSGRELDARRNMLSEAQRQWLSDRNTCGSNATCLEQQMRERIGKLDGKVPQIASIHSGQRPAAGSGSATTGISGTTNRPTVENGMQSAILAQDVFLVKSARFQEGMNSYPAVAACLEQDEIEALRPTMEQVLGAHMTGPTFLPASNLPTILKVYGDNTFIVTSGTCLKKLKFGLETAGDPDSLEITQIAEATGTEELTATAASGAPLEALPPSEDKDALRRLYVPVHLEIAPREDRLEAFVGYIRNLRSNGNYGATEIFAENEIRDRDPEFLADQYLDRWDRAFADLALTPPVVISTRVVISNHEYDFDSGQLIFPSYHGDDDDEPHLFRLRGGFGFYDASAFMNRDNRIGLISSVSMNYPRIRTDRTLLVPKIEMGAAQAEQMKLNHDRVAVDVAYRITGVERNEEGNAIFDGTVLGMNIRTDTGQQLAAFAPEDLPLVQPESFSEPVEPAGEPVSLARPRDILSAVADAVGAHRSDIIAMVYPSSAQNSFERQDTIQEWGSTAEPVDLDGFWMSGHGHPSDYDLENGTFGLDYLSLTYPKEVTGNEKRISRSDLLRFTNVNSSGVRFKMPEEQARDLLERKGSGDFAFRARLAAQKPEADVGSEVFPLDTRVAEIVIIRKDSDPAIRRDADILTRIPLTSPSEVQEVMQSTTEAAPDAAQQSASLPQPVNASEHDLLGIHVGQRFDDVFAGVRDEFDPDRIIYGHREEWMKSHAEIREPSIPLAESTVLISEGGSDLLTIFHEPLLDENPVTGAARTITFPEESRPSLEAIKGLLIEKYDAPVQENESGFLWWHAAPYEPAANTGEQSMGDLIKESTRQQNAKTHAFTCRKTLESKTGNLAYKADGRRNNGHPGFPSEFEGFDDNGEPVPAPPSNAFWPVGNFSIGSKECEGTFVIAVLERDKNGFVGAMRVLVSDLAYLLAVEEAAKEALVEQNAASDEAEPDIKL
ncbi:peptidoglycan-binding protein [Fodinicurvata sediminis]|uniref:peptidoglycan-binding protein n=1 Tax=Fodinicurvata sediminis TaxID=1121832 RepID=UPI0003F64EAF|nr:peptidoglycan-binding protein [Fodinicurvata sediminis]